MRSSPPTISRTLVQFGRSSPGSRSVDVPVALLHGGRTFDQCADQAPCHPVPAASCHDIGGSRRYSSKLVRRAGGHIAMSLPGTSHGREFTDRARFLLYLIKPSHYDDDGYVIQWVRSAIPSNSLAALH